MLLLSKFEIASSWKEMGLRGAFILLAINALLTSCSESPAPGEAMMASYLGQDVSAMVVQTLDGEPYALNDPLRPIDKPTVVNVWATWCTPCLTEMPSLDALGRSGRAQVLAIATDSSATVVKEFLRNQNWGRGMTVLHDPNGAVTREALGARALPTSAVLNPSLTVIYAIAGPRDWAEWSLNERVSTALSSKN